MIIWRGLARLMDIHLGYKLSGGVVGNYQLGRTVTESRAPGDQGRSGPFSRQPGP